jgi:hypothetical protein
MRTVLGERPLMCRRYPTASCGSARTRYGAHARRGRRNLPWSARGGCGAGHCYSARCRIARRVTFLSGCCARAGRLAALDGGFAGASR